MIQLIRYFLFFLPELVQVYDLRLPSDGRDQDGEFSQIFHADIIDFGLSLRDVLEALLSVRVVEIPVEVFVQDQVRTGADDGKTIGCDIGSSVGVGQEEGDRKSTRLNSSHVAISYAVF